MDFDEAAILFALDLSHQPAFFRSLHEPHHSVVARLQELGQLGNGGPIAARIARYSQHKLMLLRSDSTGTGHAFAEAKKAADAVTKPCQPPQSFRGKRGNFSGERVLFHKAELYHNVI
jgi:hypothetical protein